MNLIDFSSHDFSSNVSVWKDIYFEQDEWHIQWSQSEHTYFNFDGVQLDNTKLTDHSELCRFAKIMTYYNFPKKVRLNITSWSTTFARFNGVKSFIQYFLWPNQLLTATSISSVTKHQIEDQHHILFEQLKLGLKGCISRYRSYVEFLDAWSDLTRRGLLPKEYELNVKLELILNKKIRTQAYKYIDEIADTWQPMDPDNLEVAYQIAHQYLYVYAPCIIKCQDLIRNRPKLGLKDDAKSYGMVREDGQSKALFNTLLKIDVPKIDDYTKLFNFSPVTKKVTSKGYRRGWQYRTTISIAEIRPAVITLKRSCIFIIALFTGMRRREIAELKDNPTFKKNGSNYLAITRFKTSDDASGIGKPDEIPVPQIVSDAINVLIELLAKNRQNMNSDYLLLSDIYSIKKYEKIKIDTVSKDIKFFCFDTTGEYTHAHQLRKTIAWLLISKSEHNIDLIRQLFGHKSYGMTLRYILRNELIVSSVMELLEHNYTEDLNNIFQDIADGKTVGDLSDRLKERMENQKHKGQILATDIESFIHEALQVGVPMFISRLPIGAFCIKTGEQSTLPPCMEKSNSAAPQIEFCNYKECSHVLHNDESMANIASQIAYYEKKKGYLTEEADERVVAYYETEVIEHQKLLERLRQGDKPVMEGAVHAQINR